LDGDNIVNVMVKISDAIESRLREFFGNKYKDRRKHMGETIEIALREYLDREEHSSAKKRSEKKEN
jgi:hypothetical protein